MESVLSLSHPVKETVNDFIDTNRHDVEDGSEGRKPLITTMHGKTARADNSGDSIRQYAPVCCRAGVSACP